MVSINSFIVQQNIQTKSTNHQGMECGHCPEKQITVTRRYCQSLSVLYLQVGYTQSHAPLHLCYTTYTVTREKGSHKEVSSDGGVGDEH